MANLSEARKTIAYHLTQPVVQLLAKTSITPNVLTWLGFFISLIATALIATRQLFVAGWVMLLAGFFDILDGALARSTKQETPFGAALDSTLDRLSESILLLGILFLYAREGSTGEILLVGVALVGSLLVSYVRAKTEVLDLQCQVGLFTRAERVVVLALGLLLNQVAYALVTALILIAVFSFITAAQRLLNLWQQTKVK